MTNALYNIFNWHFGPWGERMTEVFNSILFPLDIPWHATRNSRYICSDFRLRPSCMYIDDGNYRFEKSTSSFVDLHCCTWNFRNCRFYERRSVLKYFCVRTLSTWDNARSPRVLRCSARATNVLFYSTLYSKKCFCSEQFIFMCALCP